MQPASGTLIKNIYYMTLKSFNIVLQGGFFLIIVTIVV